MRGCGHRGVWQRGGKYFGEDTTDQVNDACAFVLVRVACDQRT